MTLEFAQSSHTAISDAFSDKLDAINKAAAFVPSALQVQILEVFVERRRHLSFITSFKPGRLNIPAAEAIAAINELMEKGYLSFCKTEQNYRALLIARNLIHPPVVHAFDQVGIKTPPRTFTNATSQSLHIPSKLHLRDGWDDHFRHQSLPMRSQIQRVVA